MAVNWADELGIDMEALKREHPMHPDQIHMKRLLNQKAALYWSRERYLARLEGPSGLTEEEFEQRPREVKPRKKRSDAKLNRYEFTPEQLEIARRSLNGRQGV